MKKVIVTGGTGYIGSHTAVSLIENGYEVVIIDNLINSSRNALDGIEAITGIRPGFVQLDLCQQEQLDAFLEQHQDAAAVIHFAALKAVKESVEQPLRYYHNNLTALLYLLSGMRKFGIANLVFSSSATVYGAADQLPLTEESPTKPATSPYGSTKQMGEDMLRDLAKADSNCRFISLRYFNPIGAHPSGQIGELPQGIPNNLMPFITQTAAGIRKELLVFGDDYNTPDGTAVRDYIHVVDLAAAHVSAVKRLTDGKSKNNFEIFNLGTGTGSTVLQVIKSFERTSGTKLNYRLVERRSGDVEALYTATAHAEKELNWQAKYTLDDMTASSWNWEQRLRGTKQPS
ncbi:MAG: UDP-glucose 4-epimerase GalE [Bacteroidota bacterium]